MARVTKVVRDEKARYSTHKDTDCKYYVFRDSAGSKHLQLDTFGSRDRKEKGKVSQSLQFSPEAIQQLKDILSKEF